MFFQHALVGAALDELGLGFGGEDRAHHLVARVEAEQFGHEVGVHPVQACQSSFAGGQVAPGCVCRLSVHLLQRGEVELGTAGAGVHDDATLRAGAVGFGQFAVADEPLRGIDRHCLDLGAHFGLDPVADLGGLGLDAGGGLGLGVCQPSHVAQAARFQRAQRVSLRLIGHALVFGEVDTELLGLFGSAEQRPQDRACSAVLICESVASIRSITPRTSGVSSPLSDE